MSNLKQSLSITRLISEYRAKIFDFEYIPATRREAGEAIIAAIILLKNENQTLAMRAESFIRRIYKHDHEIAKLKNFTSRVVNWKDYEVLSGNNPKLVECKLLVTTDKGEELDHRKFLHIIGKSSVLLRPFVGEKVGMFFIRDATSIPDDASPISLAARL
jgi:hypothetical protein